MEKYLHLLEERILLHIFHGMADGTLQAERAKQLGKAALHIFTQYKTVDHIGTIIASLEKYPEFIAVVATVKADIQKHPGLLTGRISKEQKRSVKEWAIGHSVHVTLAAIDGIRSAKKTVQGMLNGAFFTPEEKILGKEKHPTVHIQILGKQEIFHLLTGKAKKALPDGEKRKVGVIMLGGAQAGCVNAGLLQGMEDAGVLAHVDGFFGVSGGAVASLYIAAGDGEIGAPIIFEDNTRDDFIMLSKDRREASTHLAKLLSGELAPIMDTTAFAKRAMSTRPLQLEKLKNLEKDLFAVVTNVDAGRPEYINVSKGYVVKEDATGEVSQKDIPKTDKTILDVMSATVNIPVLSTQPYTTMADGTRYGDGGISDFIPLEFAYKQGYTDMLILSNYPLHAQTNITESFLYGIIAKMAGMQGVYPEAYVQACARFIRQKNERIQYVQDVLQTKKGGSMQRVAIIAPTQEVVGQLEKDGQFLESVYTHTRAFSKQLFTKNLHQ